ncbi:hypothetical protein B6N60_00744 [Richelia sinica FACHB-800]|uniref:Uncharacterized protein n=1 Tax=Richelia sinica FACHB-800 TaxID=1357546 RepID=A0A975Y3E8_9NOST|nr:hypothetical protein B6N60_00744 [Richelia sinica FACHB-800]
MVITTNSRLLADGERISRENIGRIDIKKFCLDRF